MYFPDADLLRTSGPGGCSSSLDLQPVSPKQSSSGKAPAEGWPVQVITSPSPEDSSYEPKQHLSMVKNWHRDPEGL